MIKIDKVYRPIMDSIAGEFFPETIECWCKLLVGKEKKNMKKLGLIEIRETPNNIIKHKFKKELIVKEENEFNDKNERMVFYDFNPNEKLESGYLLEIQFYHFGNYRCFFNNF